MRGGGGLGGRRNTGRKTEERGGSDGSEKDNAELKVKWGEEGDKGMLRREKNEI